MADIDKTTKPCRRDVSQIFPSARCRAFHLFRDFRTSHLARQVDQPFALYDFKQVNQLGTARRFRGARRAQLVSNVQGAGFACIGTASKSRQFRDPEGKWRISGALITKCVC